MWTKEIFVLLLLSVLLFSAFMRNSVINQQNREETLSSIAAAQKEEIEFLNGQLEGRGLGFHS